MENFICILIIASFVLGMSCIPSRQRRQFNWSNNFDDFDNDRNNQQEPNNNLNDDSNRPINQLQRQGIPQQPEASIPTTTTTTAATTTRASASFTRCMNSCLTTQEYNPVCGTDGNTYSNQGKLRCAANCGAGVRRLRGGTCQPL